MIFHTRAPDLTMPPELRRVMTYLGNSHNPSVDRIASIASSMGWGTKSPGWVASGEDYGIAHLVLEDTSGKAAAAIYVFSAGASVRSCESYRKAWEDAGVRYLTVSKRTMAASTDERIADDLIAAVGLPKKKRGAK